MPRRKDVWTYTKRKRGSAKNRKAAAKEKKRNDSLSETEVPPSASSSSKVEKFSSDVRSQLATSESLVKNKKTSENPQLPNAVVTGSDEFHEKVIVKTEKIVSEKEQPKTNSNESPKRMLCSNALLPAFGLLESQKPEKIKEEPIKIKQEPLDKVVNKPPLKSVNEENDCEIIASLKPVKKYNIIHDKMNDVNEDIIMVGESVLFKEEEETETIITLSDDSDSDSPSAHASDLIPVKEEIQVKRESSPKLCDTAPSSPNTINEETVLNVELTAEQKEFIRLGPLLDYIDQDDQETSSLIKCSHEVIYSTGMVPSSSEPQEQSIFSKNYIVSKMVSYLNSECQFDADLFVCLEILDMIMKSFSKFKDKLMSKEEALNYLNDTMKLSATSTTFYNPDRNSSLQATCSGDQTISSVSKLSYDTQVDNCVNRNLPSSIINSNDFNNISKTILTDFSHQGVTNSQINTKNISQLLQDVNLSLLNQLSTIPNKKAQRKRSYVESENSTLQNSEICDDNTNMALSDSRNNPGFNVVDSVERNVENVNNSELANLIKTYPETFYRKKQSLDCVIIEDSSSRNCLDEESSHKKRKLDKSLYQKNKNVVSRVENNVVSIPRSTIEDSKSLNYQEEDSHKRKRIKNSHPRTTDKNADPIAKLHPFTDEDATRFINATLADLIKNSDQKENQVFSKHFNNRNQIEPRSTPQEILPGHKQQSLTTQQNLESHIQTNSLQACAPQCQQTRTQEGLQIHPSQNIMSRLDTSSSKQQQNNEERRKKKVDLREYLNRKKASESDRDPRFKNQKESESMLTLQTTCSRNGQVSFSSRDFSTINSVINDLNASETLPISKNLLNYMGNSDHSSVTQSEVVVPHLAFPLISSSNIRNHSNVNLFDSKVATSLRNEENARNKEPMKESKIALQRDPPSEIILERNFRTTLLPTPLVHEVNRSSPLLSDPRLGKLSSPVPSQIDMRRYSNSREPLLPDQPIDISSPNIFTDSFLQNIYPDQVTDQSRLAPRSSTNSPNMQLPQVAVLPISICGSRRIHNQGEFNNNPTVSRKINRSVSLVPKWLKENIGRSLISSNYIYLIVIEWNVDWFSQFEERKYPSLYPPPIGVELSQVRNTYRDDRDYFNTYFKLLLMECWYKIYSSWKDLPKSLEYRGKVYEYETKNEFNKYVVEYFVNSSECENSLREGHVVLLRFATLKKGFISMLGYVSLVRNRQFSATYDAQNEAFKVLNTNERRINKFKVTLYTVFKSDDIDTKELVFINKLTSITKILLQNDALRSVSNSSLYQTILNPITSPHKICITIPPGQNDFSGAIDKVCERILSPDPLLALISSSLTRFEKVAAISDLINKIHVTEPNAKVLICSKSENTMVELCSYLNALQHNPVYIGKDKIQEVQKFSITKLVDNVNEYRDGVSGEEALRASKIQVCEKSDALLILLLSYHEVNLLSKDLDIVCCILDDAHLCTEPESIVPISHGIKKYIMFGTNGFCDVSPLTISYDFNRSLFNRASL